MHSLHRRKPLLASPSHLVLAAASRAMARRRRTGSGISLDSREKRAASLAPAAILNVAPAVATGVSFFQLSFAFLMGGLFFSTVVAVLGAVYAFGTENTARAWAIARVIVRKIWAMVVITAGEARAVFSDPKEDSSFRANLQEARKVLNEGFIEAKRAFEESLGAVQQGRTLYAAAVGGPGLITAQYALDHMWPHNLGLNVERALAGSIATSRHKNIRKMSLTRASAGATAPQLQAARVYDLGPDAMAFDVDIRWVGMCNRLL